jgi:superfamily II DNA or RNA helicase
VSDDLSGLWGRLIDCLRTADRITSQIYISPMPSKHANAAQLIRRGLFDNLKTFTELEQRIIPLGDENTKLVGDAFEVFVEAYLATHQKMQAEAVWLVGQVPLDIRQQLNLPNDAKGIDGIFRTRAGTLVPYQVKFRSERAYLTYTEIAPFLGVTERATDRIVFTNSNELADDVKNRDAMRTVRGIDFDDLTDDDFRAISCWLREQPVAIPKLAPRDPDQVEALAQIKEALRTSNRAHVVMACGTGKTLVALWAAEALNYKTILVLVPSLTLLQQTLDEWSRHNSWGRGFTYLCVCCDPTVTAGDANDSIHLDAIDLDFHVDTNPVEVRRFIEEDTAGVKVVFSTYQSSPVVSEGMRGLVPFDLAIFDEAHRTTGPQGGLFAHSLKDANIRIRKRLFFTATPRHYDIRHRDKEGDFHTVSMDDETIYGPRAYTLTFGSAARQGIICNYKIVISVVDCQDINEFALQHGITLVEGDLIHARWVANQIAIERAVEKTHAKRVITFHSRVSSAKECGSDGTRGIKQFLSDFSVFHINGEQRSSERKQLIRSFQQAPKAIVTNARCLTEGIDVPAVDMVAFIDPRHSKIDIAQATGRAMRKPQGSNKAIGYVVIPLFLARNSGETLEEALERSDFSDVANVLNAMEEQDEDLVQIVRELREAKGHGEIFDPRQLAEKIEVVGPSIELSALRANIFAQVVDTLGMSWDEWFGRLKKYKEREGHCLVPATYTEDGFRLGGWVNTQRHNKKISIERRQRLNALGFVWRPFDSVWEMSFAALIEFKNREGHCRVPQDHIENGINLGRWVSKQRAKRKGMSIEYRQRLDDVGFVWDILVTQWEDGLRLLRQYVKREGNCLVPHKHQEDGFKLGVWVKHQRQSESKMPVAWRQKLDELGFVWSIRDSTWEQGFTALKTFRSREGHCCVPDSVVLDGFPPGIWIATSEAAIKRCPMSAGRSLMILDLFGIRINQHGRTHLLS